MSYEWEKIRLGDVSKVITDKIEISEINKKNYISTENMLPNFEGVVPASTIPNAKKVNAFRAKDILFSNIRTYFKKVWYATMDGGCSADVLVFRPKNSAIDNQFLSYVLKNEKFISYTVTTSKGTKMPRGDKKAIMNYQFYKPNLIDQQKITYILSTLDDKIELNKKINQTLESIAQAIFKSWFVDFDPVHAKANAQSEDEYDAIAKELGISREILDLFPSEFEESEVGLIPKGWEIKSLDQVAHFQNGLALQKFRPKGNSFLPVLKIAQLKRGYCDDEEKADVNIKEECIVDSGDVIFSWSGSLIVDIWCSGKAALNQHLFKVTSNTFPKWFYYFWVVEHLKKFQAIAADKAVTMGHIKRSHLTEAKCLIPPKSLFFKVDIIIKSLIDSLINTRLENINLERYKEKLLPKLLSGEIDVSNLNLGPEHD
ncbi:TPA: restriction endonuclease subunit S [Legionella pneumophila]|nr:restriction endonuclease subunit S [Legionella pneumophila]HAU1452658.1 restriction endonuclease subunit S [Legionella pneumophila]HAU1471654.1 restriction endonuclease subunit S [Legionella pneumophila]HBP6879131.1 restriction endonuclease subunit S [Legionella pneumophila]HCX3843083.1 restriction endonuclease subunit S [Legionella pneumophila]